MIIETSDNRFYRVTETTMPTLSHCWYGVEVKRIGGQWVEKSKATKKSRVHLVRKAATRVVEA